jgi:hypothetical protein
MAEISAKVFLLIGGAVGALSVVVMLINPENNLTFFAFIGVCMFLYGIYKFVTQKKDVHKIQDKHLHGKHPPKHIKDHHGKQQVAHGSHHRPPHQEGYELKHHGHAGKSESMDNVHPDHFCPKCGNKMKSFDNFCSNCGFRTR